MSAYGGSCSTGSGISTSDFNASTSYRKGLTCGASLHPQIEKLLESGQDHIVISHAYRWWINDAHSAEFVRGINATLPDGLCARRQMVFNTSTRCFDSQVVVGPPGWRIRVPSWAVRTYGLIRRMIAGFITLFSN